MKNSQVLDSGDKELKTATINMLKELKETILNKQCIIKYRISVKSYELPKKKK